MKDKDSYLLEELYANISKPTDGSTVFIDEEYNALVEIGSNLEQQDDKYARINSEYHVSKGGNTAAFKVNGAYSVNTQHETMWEKFSKEIHIEKASPNLYYVAIGDKSFEVESFGKVLEYIKDNI
jgi:hypothetical protein